jgi:hypothetical protein
MAIVPVEPAVAGQVALSAENNKIINNVIDVDNRLQDVEAAIANGDTGNAALDSRLDVVEARTTNVSTGNTALGTRVTSLETITADGTTGNAALGSRLTTVESRTTNATYGNTALDTRLATVETRTTSATIGNQKLRDDLDALTGEVDTERGRHIFTGSRAYGPGVNDQAVNNWSTTETDGFVTLGSSTNFTLTKAGRWAFVIRASSDGGPNGISEIRLNWTGGAIADNGLYKCEWRGGGFAGSGKLIQTMSWTGYVEAGHIANAFSFNAAWTPQTVLDNIMYNWIFEAYFMGA